MVKKEGKEEHERHGEVMQKQKRPLGVTKLNKELSSTDLMEANTFFFTQAHTRK